MTAEKEVKLVIRSTCATSHVWWQKLSPGQVNALHAALKREGWLRTARERAAVWPPSLRESLPQEEPHTP